MRLSERKKKKNLTIVKGHGRRENWQKLGQNSVAEDMIRGPLTNLKVATLLQHVADEDDVAPLRVKRNVATYQWPIFRVCCNTKAPRIFQNFPNQTT